MGFISDALEQIRLGQYKSAALILRENIEDSSLKPSSKIDLMEWIADCYSKDDEPAEASIWFENAAKAVLDLKDSTQIERKRKAVKNIEKAIECCKSANDLEGIRRLTKLKFSLTPSF